MTKLLLVVALLVAFPVSAETLTDDFAGQARGENNPGGCEKTRNITLSFYDTGKIRYKNDQGNLTFGELNPDGSFSIVTAPNNPNRRFEMSGGLTPDRKSVTGKYYFSNDRGRCHYTFNFQKK